MEASPLLVAFREFARRYSLAERRYANARATERNLDGCDAALAEKQALEREFADCFSIRRLPDWDQVQRAARGELAGEGAR